MKNRIYHHSIYLFTGLLLLLLGCKEEKGWTLMEDDQTKPGLVQHPSVVNGYGQATIHYSLPENDNILYVKAEYVMASGETRVVKSSTYTNEILIDGFPDTKQHTVKLYAVSKAEVVSDPVDVIVEPKTPIFNLVFGEMKVTAAFGGIRITSTNKEKGNIVIVPMVDSLNNGEYLPLDNYYGQDSVILYNVRGLKSKEMKFAFYVRDRWLNKSDTLYTSITPLEENLFNRQLFTPLRLPGDAQILYGSMDNLWDGNLNTSKWPSFYTVENAGVPQSVTFSIGKEAKLSRVVIFPRRENGFYDKGNLRDFEIWGSNTPNLDGSWESWAKLATCTVRKPSGTPSGTNTNADEVYGTSGWSFDLPEDAPKYKYLRIRNLRNWRGSYFMQINQIQVWGVY
ncbi:MULTISPECIES: DUF5000 domain-containing lipoprotein [unclassified Sphingobacterium]|uniref:DUF5000 domain-containing lipoprotein n=1 Tax=unclassified Sphingobacterium TaxID=2609468 RepID=UPI0025F89BAB|nr:DUF5000 domain-containing lipoprotein [Sphingobacterium sp. UBA5670]